jgi:dihydrofolate reductase
MGARPDGCPKSPLGETLLKERLIDVLDLPIHPLVLGRGKLFFRDDQIVKLKLVATRPLRTS